MKPALIEREEVKDRPKLKYLEAEEPK